MNKPDVTEELASGNVSAPARGWTAGQRITMESPGSLDQVVRAQLRRAQSNLGTAIAVIKDARKGGEISSYKIRQYCDEAVLAIEAIESLRSNAGGER